VPDLHDDLARWTSMTTATPRRSFTPRRHVPEPWDL